MAKATEEKKVNLRGLLTKKPFVRILPDSNGKVNREFSVLGEMALNGDKCKYEEVTQADFLREYDPNSHAINDREIYKNYRKGDDGLYYEQDFPRYAFPFQSEITDDRLGRLTINDIQFDLADKTDDQKAWDTYNIHRAGWVDKRMENAWHYLVKSVLITGDGAVVGILNKGKFSWKALSYLNGDVLYPHYSNRTGKLSVFARTYTDYNDDGEEKRYIDVWDDQFYYRFVEGVYEEDIPEENRVTKVKGYSVDGFILEEKALHGFDEIPVAYKRSDFGPCWSPVQELIEHYESAFSRLAQSNHDFGLPIMYLKGKGKQIKEIATSDMSYASKIFIIPQEGEAGFLNRQDASNAYKTEIDEIKKKIYEGAMVVKAPELKSGDTPAAAIELLYSDSFNKAALEAQEYDEVICKLIDIYEYGFGVESEHRLDFQNTRITFWIQPHLPINTQEITTNLATAVQNKFVSKQTASEKFYFSTAQEWRRIKKEQHDEQMEELLLEEQRLEMQNNANVEMQEELSEIQTEQQIDVIKAENKIEGNKDDDTAKAVKTRKGRVNTGRGVGRPRTVGTDKWGNRQNENNWKGWNSTH